MSYRDLAERAVAGEEGPPADEQAHSAVLARDVPGAFFS